MRYPYILKIQKKTSIFAIHQEIKDSFKGSILLQNIFYIYIFNKNQKDIHYQILKFFLTLKINIGKKFITSF